MCERGGVLNASGKLTGSGSGDMDHICDRAWGTTRHVHDKRPNSQETSQFDIQFAAALLSLLRQERTAGRTA